MKFVSSFGECEFNQERFRGSHRTEFGDIVPAKFSVSREILFPSEMLEQLRVIGPGRTTNRMT